jgi:hypothetical protein
MAVPSIYYISLKLATVSVPLPVIAAQNVTNCRFDFPNFYDTC